MQITPKEFTDSRSHDHYYNMKGIGDDGKKHNSQQVIEKTCELLNGLTEQQRAAVTNYGLTMLVKGYRDGYDRSPYTSLVDMRDGMEADERIVLNQIYILPKRYQ